MPEFVVAATVCVQAVDQADAEEQVALALVMGGWDVEECIADPAEDEENDDEIDAANMVGVRAVLQALNIRPAGAAL